jgi:hypothetical protein
MKKVMSLLLALLLFTPAKFAYAQVSGKPIDAFQFVLDYHTNALSQGVDRDSLGDATYIPLPSGSLVRYHLTTLYVDSVLNVISAEFDVSAPDFTEILAPMAAFIDTIESDNPLHKNRTDGTIVQMMYMLELFKTSKELPILFTNYRIYYDKEKAAIIAEYMIPDQR